MFGFLRSLVSVQTWSPVKDDTTTTTATTSPARSTRTRTPSDASLISVPSSSSSASLVSVSTPPSSAPSLKQTARPAPAPKPAAAPIDPRARTTYLWTKKTQRPGMWKAKPAPAIVATPVTEPGEVSRGYSANRDKREKARKGRAKRGEEEQWEVDAAEALKRMQYKTPAFY